MDPGNTFGIHASRPEGAPFPQVVQERLRFVLVLEADDRIVRKADHDTMGAGSANLRAPQFVTVVTGMPITEILR
jgi:hypothetical protein